MILPIETDKHGNPAHGAVIRALTMLIEEHNTLIEHIFGKDVSRIRLNSLVDDKQNPNEGGPVVGEFK